MKKWSGTAVTLLLVFVLSVTLAPGTVWAKEDVMHLQTAVPGQHQITIQPIKGTVVCGSHAVKHSTVIPAKRHTAQTYEFRADSGYRLFQVFYDGEDVTGQVYKNSYVSPEISRDVTLQVVFKREDQTVPDEKTYLVTGRLLDSAGNPIQGVTVVLYSTPKTSVTDQNGEFRFEQVEAGRHTLLVYDTGGTVIGYGELSIQKAVGAELSDSLGSSGEVSIIPSLKTVEIHMEMQLDGQPDGGGNIRFGGVTDNTEPIQTPGDKPEEDPSDEPGDKPSDDPGDHPGDEPQDNQEEDPGKEQQVKAVRSRSSKTGDDTDAGICLAGILCSLSVCILIIKRKRTGP